MVRASIVLADEATLKKYSAKNIASNTEAKSYRIGLKAQQDALAQKISSEVLDGEKLDVVWNITLAANIISANIPYDKVDAVRNTIGVKDVVLETKYEAAVASKDSNDPNMATASEMVGGNYAWAAGYTGAGSKVAIVDTGLDIDHQSFDAGALEESLKGKEVALLNADEVTKAFDMLNASGFLDSSDGIYRNTKVPYGVNYVDQNLNIVHINDRQGEHGSHVAGIAAANSLIPDGNGGYEKALDTVKTQGEAPDAQLMIMKVFGEGGGAYDSDYMVAIEDAIVLGADSVNLSLGSGNPGLVSNRTYETILNEVAEATNLVWTNSAGNSYNWAQYSSHQFLYADDVSFATTGSPATYPPTLSVASVDNKGTTAYSFDAAGIKCYYAETSYGNEPLATIAGDYEYVLLDGPGVGIDPANPTVDANENVGKEGDQFWALGKEVIEGKVAFCYRGTSSFFAKANAAAAMGAKAVVIINNQAGVINMNLTGYTYTAPVVSILQADGDAIKAASEKVTTDAGLEYYTGKMTVSKEIGVVNPGDDFIYSMSDFSSWGVPGDLSMKPEITAPGGNIYSIFGDSLDPDGNPQGGHEAYENMSGTSMASPQVAGLCAVLAQYIRENDLVEKTGRTQRQLILSLLMSTAEPMVDDYDEYFPVIQQGAGLANVNNAISAKSYISIDDVAKKAPASAASSIKGGKVKVELGEVTGDSFSASFTLHNFSDEEVKYDLNADFFTQLVYNYPEDGYNHRLGYIDYLDLAY
ncbi:MAG: S8 family serine peptidase, partial [Erysipelotrichaceae bacterium]|nr:S8 family serine peptidase [Erysipelotrichaceae bacterium]